MHPFELISLISAVITPVLLIYIFMLIFTFGRRYLREYNRGKVLKFTKDEIKETRDAIINLNFKHVPNEETIFMLISRFNEISVGINEGLYDEIYVRLVLGDEMLNIYKEFRSKYEGRLLVSESAYLPLELLLKKWDYDGDSSYYLKNKRRFR